MYTLSIYLGTAWGLRPQVVKTDNPLLLLVSCTATVQYSSFTDANDSVLLFASNLSSTPPASMMTASVSSSYRCK